MIGKLSMEYIPTCVHQEIARNAGLDHETVAKVIRELQDIASKQRDQIRQGELREMALAKLTPQERAAILAGTNPSST